MATSRVKGPPKSFETQKAAREALAHLADSLKTYDFAWPAAAIRSYLTGRCPSLDQAFGLPPKALPNAPSKAKAPPQAKPRAAPKARRAAKAPKRR